MADEFELMAAALEERAARLVELDGKYGGQVAMTMSRVADVTEEFVSRSEQALTLMKSKLNRVSDNSTERDSAEVARICNEYLSVVQAYENDKIMKLNKILESLPTEIVNEMI